MLTFFSVKSSAIFVISGYFQIFTKRIVSITIFIKPGTPIIFITFRCCLQEGYPSGVSVMYTVRLFLSDIPWFCMTNKYLHRKVAFTSHKSSLKYSWINRFPALPAFSYATLLAKCASVLISRGKRQGTYWSGAIGTRLVNPAHALSSSQADTASSSVRALPYTPVQYASEWIWYFPAVWKSYSLYKFVVCVKGKSSITRFYYMP